MTSRPRPSLLTPVFLLLVAAALLGSGCGEGVASAARAATPAEARVVANGTQMVSPISGKTITKQSDTPVALYDGKLFFFCCVVDRDRFIEQPQVYADTVLPPNGRIVEK